MALQPTSEAERLHALDAMRGVAILGVLIAYTVWSLGNPPGETWSRLDRWVERGVDLFVDSKFYTMFACLFGVGVAQQWRRWEAAGREVVPLHMRRMGFLLAIGLAHGALVRNGDILAPYALMGMLLLLFRRASNVTVAIAGALLVLTPSAVQWFMGATGRSWPPRPDAASAGYFIENLTWLRYWYVTSPFTTWPQVLGIMLAGLLIGRARAIERLAAGRGPGGWWVLAVALAGALIARIGLESLAAHRPGWLPGVWRRIALGLLYNVGAWFLAATYGTALLLLMRSQAWVARLWPIRAVGRMAFTNYLLQGVTIVPLCLVFGLFDKISPATGLWFGLAVALAQILFSAWWLKRHAMGPMERMWRRVTYGAAVNG